MNEKSLERTLLLQDLLVIGVSLWLSHWIRMRVVAVVPGLKPAVPLAETFQVLIVFLPTWAWCAEHLQLHRVRTLAGPLIELVRALLLTQGWGALALGLILMVAQAPLNRSSIGIHLVVSTLLLLAAKLAQRHWVGTMRGELTALVVGECASDLFSDLRDRRGRTVEAHPSLAPEALAERLQVGAVDEVVFGGDPSEPVLRPLLRLCLERGVPVLVRVEHVDIDVARPRPTLVGATLYLTYDVQEPDRPSLLVKALVDRVSAAVLLILTLPLLLLIAAAIRLASPGPVLFVQRRGGINGRPFGMLKFRTMRVGAEDEREALLHANEMDGPVFKISRDPRVFPLGRLLRSTSCDELPQLVNVLVGQMSLVGPRPLPLVETGNLEGAHRRRLSVRPGITGLWQVSGRSELGFERWMALDLEYVDRWSLGLDMVILLRTLPALFSRRGAR